MIRATLTIFYITIISSVWGLEIIDRNLFNIYTFHLPMVIFEAISIVLIRSKPDKPITDILTALLSLSIINHSVGAYGWVCGIDSISNAYDFIRPIIFIMEVLVLAGGWCNRISNSKHTYFTRARNPNLRIVDSNKADDLCN